MDIIRSLTLMFFASSLPLGANQAAIITTHEIADIEKKIKAHCQLQQRMGWVVGAAFGIIDGDRHYIFTCGLKKQGTKNLIGTKTLFQIGSLSKPFSASLFLRAQQKKKISLGTPISIATRRPVTVGQVLSHTSGYGRFGWNMQIEKGASRQDLLKLLSARSQSIPGKIFDYHNVVFSLVEESLSKALNMSFGKAMEQEIFKPLGMTDATIGIGPFLKKSDRAWPHERAKNGRLIPSKAYSSRYHETVVSSAGINAHITDMFKFLRLQLGLCPSVITPSELSSTHQKIISAKDADRWFRTRFNGDFSCHYGYGWRIVATKNEEIIFHGGWLQGFVSFLGFSPQKKRGIVVLTNSESSFALSTGMDFLEGRFDGS